MAYSPDHSLAPASAAPSGIPSGLPDSPSVVPAGPPWPNPLASIAYASCRPADMDPPAEDSALTSQAAYERLNRAAARAETLVLYRLDMLAGCRDSLDVDQTRLESSIQNLWRLTAVRKTLMSIEAALSAPTPAPQGAAPGVDLQSALDEVRRLLDEVPTESAPAPDESPSPSPSPSQSELESQSQSCSQSHSDSSIESIPPVAQSPSPQVSPSSPVAQSPSPQVSRSSSLSIGSVPACPRLSLSSAARTLDRVNSDMANYTEYVTTAADYDTNVTAEEFLRPSLSPKSSRATAFNPSRATAPAADQAPAPIADNSTSDLLSDPDLSPSLKTQISIRNLQSAIRNTSSRPQVSQSPCPPVAKSSSPHSDRPPD